MTVVIQLSTADVKAALPSIIQIHKIKQNDY